MILIEFAFIYFEINKNPDEYSVMFVYNSIIVYDKIYFSFRNVLRKLPIFDTFNLFGHIYLSNCCSDIKCIY